MGFKTCGDVPGSSVVQLASVEKKWQDDRLFSGYSIYFSFLARVVRNEIVVEMAG